MNENSCNKYKLEDLIDIKHFQNLQDRLNEIYSFPSSIIDNEGNILTATAWQDICTSFHRKNEECKKECIKSDQYIIDHLDEANPAVTYQCPHGLVDNATPIIVDGVHYGNFFTGQFFLEKPNIDFFKQQAKKYGFPETPYIEAVKKVPIWSMEQLNNYLHFIKGLIAIITESALKNLKEIETKKQIQESEERYRSVIETVKDGIILQDASGKILNWNKGAEKIFGISAEDVIGKTSEGNDWPTIREDGSKYEGKDHPSMRTLRTGKPYKNEIMGVYRSPEDLRWIAVNTSPLFHNNEEKPYAVAISFSDITDLKSEKDTSQNYLNVAGVMIMALNETGEITLINKKGCEILEGTENDLTGRNFFDLFTPKDLVEKVKKTYQNLMMGKIEGVAYAEREIVTLSGTQKVIAWNNTILRDRNIRVIGTLSSGEDITEKRLAEKSLRESEKQNRAILKTAMDGFWRVDTKGNLLEVNKAYCMMSGYSEQELLCMNISNLEASESIKGVEEHVIKIINEGNDRFESRHRRKNGTIFDVEISAQYIDELEGLFYVFIRDITERKQSARALSKSEKRYRDIVENVNDGIFIHDFKGHILDVNENVCRMMGYERSELVGNNLSIIDSPENKHELPGRMDSLLSEDSILFEGKHIRKDGVTIFTEVSAKVVSREDNGIIQGFVRDISDRKKAEIKLRDNENKMKSIFKAAPVGIGVVINRVFKEVNERFCGMTGYTREELIGHSSRMVYPSDKEYEYVGTKKYRDIDKYGTGSIDTKFKRKDGKIIDVIVSSTPLDPADLTSGVTFTALEITERKNYERNLKESEERFRDLAEMLPEAIFEADSNMKLTFVNKQAFSMFGYTQEEFENGLHGYDMLVPEDRDKARENIRKKINGKTTGVSEYHALRKDQTAFPVLFHTNILTRDGSITGFRGVIIDISEQKLIEEHLRQAQKMEGIGTLAGGIAHDFNNILSPIMIHAEMIMDDLLPDNPLKQDVKEIYKAGKRARDLVQQILTFARKRDEEKVVLRASLVIKEAVKFLRSTIPTTIDIEFEIKTDQDRILADPTQINQIVMNLCTNAAHSMKEKGGILTIAVDKEEINSERINGVFVLKPGKYLKISVEDSGAGISPEDMHRIFEPYYTTKKTGEGTGLGLAIIHGIVQSYGGDIVLKSEVGRGTTFHIYLPLVETATETIEKPPDIEMPKGNERILIVDDEEAILNALQKMLTRLGYIVTSGTKALEIFDIFSNDPEAFDLVITDMTMPDMTGKELAGKVRKTRPDIPVILCTGFSDQINESEASKMGINAFIMKPIIRSEIAKTIRKVLE